MALIVALCRCINKQLMQVYGFVIPGGNPADRLPLVDDSADSDAPDRHWFEIAPPAQITCKLPYNSFFSGLSHLTVISNTPLGGTRVINVQQSHVPQALCLESGSSESKD